MARLLAIEWNDAEARAVVAASRGEDVVIEQAFSVALRAPAPAADQAGPDVGPQIAAALAARGIGRIDALVSVGRANLELRQLSLPPAPDEELPELVRFQALREFTGLQEDWPLDFLPIDDDPQQARRVLAAAIDRKLVEEIQKTCHAAGLKPRKLLLRACAGASLLQRRTDAGAAQVRLLVDMLDDEADLTVLIDRKVVFLRTARLPGDPLAAAESAQALLAEIRRTIAAAQNQLDSRRVEAIVLFGTGPQHTALAELLAQQLAMPAELFDPFAEVRLEGELRRALPKHPGRFAPLLGMLVDELTASSHAIDFLHPRRRPQPPSRRSTYILAGAAGAGVVLLALLFGWLQLQGLEKEIGQLDQESKDLDDELARAPKVLDAVEEIDKWRSSDVTWLNELRWLSENLPKAEEVMLTQLQAGPSTQARARPGTRGGELSLEGLARSVDTLGAMKKSLCDPQHDLVNKDMSADTSHKLYSLRFKCSVYVTPETP